MLRARFAVLAGLLASYGCGGAAPPPPSTPSPPTSPSSPADATPSGPAASTDAKPAAWPFGPAVTAEQRAEQLARFAKDPGPVRSNWEPPGKSERYGHAEGLVSAPLEAVKARLVDYAHYKDLAGPKFKKVNVVDKQGTATDVYFQLPIMKGIVTIWYKTRFVPPRTVPDVGEVFEGTFVEGNIKGMHIAFTLRKGADDKSTVMMCDLLLSLKIPAPQANVDEELRDACGDAINAVKRLTASPP